MTIRESKFGRLIILDDRKKMVVKKEKAEIKRIEAYHSPENFAKQLADLTNEVNLIHNGKKKGVA